MKLLPNEIGGADMSDRISTQADGKDLKSYEKPRLKKGPVLSHVTARQSVSPIRDDP